jgi:hypothetical protein
MEDFPCRNSAYHLPVFETLTVAAVGKPLSAIEYTSRVYGDSKEFFSGRLTFLDVPSNLGM